MKSFLDKNNWDWIFLSPEDILQNDRLRPLPGVIGLILLVSAIFSHALADTFMKKSAYHFFSNPPLLPTLGLKFSAHAWTWGIAVIIIYEILKLCKGAPLSVWDWIKLSAMALVPYHLMLPIALLTKPFGFLGLLTYGLAKVVVLFAVLKRFMGVAENQTHWPAWACLLTAVMPFFLTSLVFLLLLIGSLSLLSLGLVAALW